MGRPLPASTAPRVNARLPCLPRSPSLVLGVCSRSSGGGLPRAALAADAGEVGLLPAQGPCASTCTAGAHALPQCTCAAAAARPPPPPPPLPRLADHPCGACPRSACRVAIIFGIMMWPNIWMLFFPIPQSSFLQTLTGLQYTEMIRYHRCQVPPRWSWPRACSASRPTLAGKAP